MRTLLCQIQELGNTSSLLTLVSSAMAAPGSKASVIFETLCSKGLNPDLAPDLASHVECFEVKAASLDLPTEMAIAMFHNSLDAASVMVGSIMPGIVHPSKKAWKAGKPVSKLAKLMDLNQMVDQKWVTAAPVCQLKPAPPFKLTLIN
ncbi:hypothetical protein DSO57_1015023 [Entomophthora muscae]|uniref:Uncharacterized protein n=1 Tax=Entomophthora muscae TaxID=34485 RepID=A0ACC2S7B4_9FUNG|nr:hypothetical protein DSO57_1015023 [Entomophthora muscae]